MKKIRNTIFISLLIICMLTSCTEITDKDVILKGEPTIPSNTNVIFHFTTRIDPRSATKYAVENNGYSQLIYFDNDGEVTGGFELDKEIIKDFITQKGNDIFYFFNNFTLIATSKNYLVKEVTSGIEIIRTKFGPNLAEKLPKKDLCYSFLNVGGNGSDSYITVLRIASNTETYDVIIPHVIHSITYDEVNDRFIYQLEPVNEGVSTEAFEYGIVSFNHERKKYVYDDMKYQISYSHKIYNETIGYSNIFSNGNVVYKISETYPEEDMVDEKGELLPAEEQAKSRRAILVLTKFDLESKTAQDFIVTQPYERNEGDSGILAGSTDLPASFHNGKMYIFTSDNKMHIIEDENNIEVFDLNFDFSNTANRRHPFKQINYKPREDFFNSIVSIEDDGKLYVANIYNDKKLRIHKLNDSGEFELFWESANEIPAFKRRNMQINTFEIIG